MSKTKLEEKIKEHCGCYTDCSKCPYNNRQDTCIQELIYDIAINDFKEALKETYAPVQGIEADAYTSVCNRFDALAEELKKNKS